MKMIDMQVTKIKPSNDEVGNLRRALYFINDILDKMETNNYKEIICIDYEDLVTINVKDVKCAANTLDLLSGIMEMGNYKDEY